jgi:glycosyltransferase involved in cell wall biosynthesis
MRVMLDVLGLPPYGGARTAAIGWVTALAKFSPENQFITLVNQREPVFEPFSNIEQIIISTPGRLLPRLQLQAVLPFLVKKHRIDVVHFLRNLAAVVPGMPVVVNINDLTRLFFPEMFSRWDILYWKLVQSKVLRFAQRIICISNQTRQDVSHWLNYPPDKIVTIFPSISEIYRPINTEISNQVKIKYRLPENFVLYVGGLAKHKNLRTLIEAFILLKQSTILPHALVIVGGQYHTHNDTQVQEIANRCLENQIIFTGTVSEEDMPFLYNAAEAFIFPSLYEGFGLAPLEAMACGTPVVASRVGSLPEVLGQAAYWVDNPLDKQAFIAAIGQVLQDSLLRKRLIQQGAEQARHFSWQKTATHTTRLYEGLVTEQRSKAL